MSGNLGYRRTRYNKASSKLAKEIGWNGLIFFVLLLTGLFLILFFSKAANAQMANEPWGFQPQNRASIAALMQQVEDSNASNSLQALGAGGYDQLVCGSDGASSATGNSTCIIMSNSDGVIQIGQDADGDQDATNTDTTTMSGLSEVLETIEE